MDSVGDLDVDRLALHSGTMSPAFVASEPATPGANGAGTPRLTRVGSGSGRKRSGSTATVGRSPLAVNVRSQRALTVGGSPLAGPTVAPAVPGAASLIGAPALPVAGGTASVVSTGVAAARGPSLSYGGASMASRHTHGGPGSPTGGIPSRSVFVPAPGGSAAYVPGYSAPHGNHFPAASIATVAAGAGAAAAPLAAHQASLLQPAPARAVGRSLSDGAAEDHAARLTRTLYHLAEAQATPPADYDPFDEEPVYSPGAAVDVHSIAHLSGVHASMLSSSLRSTSSRTSVRGSGFGLPGFNVLPAIHADSDDEGDERSPRLHDTGAPQSIISILVGAVPSIGGVGALPQFPGLAPSTMPVENTAAGLPHHAFATADVQSHAAVPPEPRLAQAHAQTAAASKQVLVAASHLFQHHSQHLPAGQLPFPAQPAFGEGVGASHALQLASSLSTAHPTAPVVAVHQQHKPIGAPGVTGIAAHAPRASPTLTMPECAAGPRAAPMGAHVAGALGSLGTAASRRSASATPAAHPHPPDRYLASPSSPSQFLQTDTDAAVTSDDGSSSATHAGSSHLSTDTALVSNAAARGSAAGSAAAGSADDEAPTGTANWLPPRARIASSTSTRSHLGQGHGTVDDDSFPDIAETSLTASYDGDVDGSATENAGAGSGAAGSTATRRQTGGSVGEDSVYSSAITLGGLSAAPATESSSSACDIAHAAAAGRSYPATEPPLPATNLDVAALGVEHRWDARVRASGVTDKQHHPHPASSSVNAAPGDVAEPEPVI